MLITLQYIISNLISTLQNCLSDGVCSLATCKVGTFMYQSFISVDITYAVDANLYNAINVSTCLIKSCFKTYDSLWSVYYLQSYALLDLIFSLQVLCLYTQKAFGDLLKTKLLTFSCFFLSKTNSHKFIVVNPVSSILSLTGNLRHI